MRVRRARLASVLVCGVVAAGPLPACTSPPPSSPVPPSATGAAASPQRFQSLVDKASRATGDAVGPLEWIEQDHPGPAAGQPQRYLAACQARPHDGHLGRGRQWLGLGECGGWPRRVIVGPTFLGCALGHPALASFG